MIELRRKSDNRPFLAAQWNGLADELVEIGRLGFELQAEEGQRTGQKPLVVYDPTDHGYNPLKIRIGWWGLRDSATCKLHILTNDEVQDEFTVFQPERTRRYRIGKRSA